MKSSKMNLHENRTSNKCNTESKLPQLNDPIELFSRTSQKRVKSSQRITPSSLVSSENVDPKRKCPLTDKALLRHNYRVSNTRYHSVVIAQIPMSRTLALCLFSSLCLTLLSISLSVATASSQSITAHNRLHESDANDENNRQAPARYRDGDEIHEYPKIEHRQHNVIPQNSHLYSGDRIASSMNKSPHLSDERGKLLSSSKRSSIQSARKHKIVDTKRVSRDTEYSSSSVSGGGSSSSGSSSSSISSRRLTNGATNHRPCKGYLALPLMSMAGHGHIKEFIIPQSGPLRLNQQQHGERTPEKPQQRTQIPSNRQQQQQQQQETSAHGSYDGQQPHQGYYEHANGSHEPLISLEPKSDDKCPMTGPSTVCDQINFYPADTILDKLESAKKRLGENYFNLDSFFSDESENSGEPFDVVTLDKGNLMTRSKATKITIYDGYEEQGLIRYSRPSARTVTTTTIRTNLPNHSKSTDLDLKRTEGYGFERNQTSDRVNPMSRSVDLETYTRSPDDRRTIDRQPTSGKSRAANVRSSVQDEFVDLVESHAISINDQRRFLSEDLTRLPLEVNIDANNNQQRSAATGGQGSARYRTLSSVGLRSILTPNTTSTERIFPPEVGPEDRPQLLAILDKTGYDKAEREQDNQNNYHFRAESKSSIAHNIPIASTLSLPSYGPSRVSNRAANSSAGRSAPTMIRSRRQVSSVRVNASSGSPSMSTDSNPEDNNDSINVSNSPSESDISSSAPNPDNQAEPVCRARSIYISPKAALNDKKQWKYVVNAPELNPQVRQIIRVDVCENPFGPCSDQISIPFGFISECKQKYSKKKLLALDSRSGLLEVDTFFIPSCCVCQLRMSAQSDNSPLIQPNPGEDVSGSQPDEDNRTNDSSIDNSSG